MIGQGGAFLKRWEIWMVWALGAASLAAIPIARGESGIIWDALNHHIYLGWIAEHPRFDQDFLAAGWQSYQYPYLYWPAYKLAVMGASGATAGVFLSLLQSLVIPPVWLVSRSVCPGAGAQDVAFRWLAVALALIGGVTLSLLQTTSNDLVAGIPLVWAIALGFLANEGGGTRERQLRLVALSGACAGLSVAFKFSNGPLALVLPFLWASWPSALSGAAKRIFLGGITTVLAFVVAYAPWGWVLWKQFQNPFYPLYPLQTLRVWLGA